MSLFKNIQTAREMAEALDSGTTAAQRPKREHYLGMSALGKCRRELWLGYHKPSKRVVEPRVQRIFDMGNQVEDMIEAYLRATTTLEVVGTQRSYEALDGRVRGHSDFLTKFKDRLWVLDAKSMNANKFKMFVNMGLAVSHPEYIAQGIMYSGYEIDTYDNDIQGAGVIGMNKDNCEMHVQLFDFERGRFEFLKQKALEVLESEEEPDCDNIHNSRWCACKRGG